MKRTSKRTMKRRATLGPQELRAVGKSVRDHFRGRADRGAAGPARRVDARAGLRVAPMTRERLATIRLGGRRRAVDTPTVLALVEEIDRLRAWLERIARSPGDSRASARAALRGRFARPGGR